MTDILTLHLTPEFFEGVMLVCFGAAWPASILRLIRTKKTHGKSLSFLFLILTGYIAGIVFELTSRNSDVKYLYYLNTLMVLIEISLLLAFRAAEKAHK